MSWHSHDCKGNLNAYLSDRIITARLQTRVSWITIIQTYASIEDPEETYKNVFYDQLQDVLENAPRHHLNT